MAEFVLDTSVVVAIVLREPAWGDFSACLAEAQQIYMCAGTALECELVLGKKRPVSVTEGRFWSNLQKAKNLEIVSFDRHRLNIAKQALKDFGTGRHRLNFGDCHAYSLAQSLGLPLLFMGHDFAATNVRVHPASVIPA
jgi:ribonuclease VapC